MTDAKPLSDHPSDSELDALRAGLYDDRIDERETLRAHVDACGACRDRVAIWNETKHALGVERPGVRTQLSARRAAALAGTAAAVPRAGWRVPMALAASVAVLAIALGVALHTSENNGDGQLAETETADLYTDIDFYLWLLRKQQDDMGSSG